MNQSGTIGFYGNILKFFSTYRTVVGFGKQIILFFILRYLFLFYLFPFYFLFFFFLFFVQVEIVQIF